MKYLLSLLLALTFTLQSCSGDGEESTSVNQAEETETADSLATDSISQVEIDFDITSYEELMSFGSSAEAELNSLDHYWTGYQLVVDNLDQEQREDSYFGYVAIMTRISEDKYWSWGEFDEEETTALYKPYGLNMWGGEGEYSLAVDTSVPGDLFKDDISDEVYQYSQLGKIEGRQLSADAGLIIDLEELGDILFDAEERYIDNYDSRYSPEFYSTYLHILEYMMYGLENTRAVWPGEGEIDPMFYEEYGRIIDDGSHKSGWIIQEHITRLEESDYEVSYSDRWMPTKDMVHTAFDLPLTGE